MSLLEATSIRHPYPGGFSLGVDRIGLEQGEVVALLGPSGAGKSTLVRIMGLIERPANGEVSLDGNRVTPRDLRSRRRIAAVLQGAPMWRGTVGDNVAFGLSIHRVASSERRGKVAGALERVGLGGLADRDASELSGGQAQRVALARALALEVEILLLDEPLAHIDEPQREALAVALKGFIDDRGGAALWVTHDRAEALAVSDRVAVMVDGDLVQVGGSLQVFSQPSDERVARLVGADNLVPGRVRSVSGGIVVIDAEGAAIETPGELEVGTEVMVTVRPENVSVWKRPPEAPSPRNRYKGKVLEAVVLGPLVRLRLEGELALTALITRPTSEEMGLRVGADVWFGFKATAAHLIRRS